MPNFYCKYCGLKYSNVSALISGSCSQHPLDANKGKHVLYEGSEKSEYTCKHCALKYSSIFSMTSGACSMHPNGTYKGRHEPAI